MSLRELTQRYEALVLADQAGGPCEATEEAYGAIVAALLRDGSTTARAYGKGGFWRSHEADPYASLDALARAARVARHDGWPVEISDVNHSGAFLGNDAANFAFRAHHDAMHVLLLAPMTLVGETIVALHTIESLGLFPREAAVLTAEIVGQSLFFEKYGHFPLVSGSQPFACPTYELVSWAADAYSEILPNETYIWNETRRS